LIHACEDLIPGIHESVAMPPAMNQPPDPTAANLPDGPHLRLAGGPADSVLPAGLGSTDSSAAAGNDLWTPPAGMRWSQWAKIGAGAAATAAFAGWMIHKWDNRLLRLGAAVFACLTGYLTYRIILEDLRRKRVRQVRLLHEALYVTAHDGVCVIPLDQVLFAQWRSDLDAASGLWFFDHDKKVLAHLNADFLVDQSQARSLLTWVGSHCPVSFEVRWS
jgi:hypothetical protein